MRLADRNKSIFTLPLTMISLISFLTISCITNADTHDKYDRNLIIKGTIVGIILTEKFKGESFLIIRLDDGKNYRLKPEHGLGFIVGSDVELETTNICKEDEITMLNKVLICVNSINITAMAISGPKIKIKYPPTTPPEILIQSEEILDKIDKFKIEQFRSKE